jgi:hypothetical protein
MHRALLEFAGTTEKSPDRVSGVENFLNFPLLLVVDDDRRGLGLGSKLGRQRVRGGMPPIELARSVWPSVCGWKTVGYSSKSAAEGA